MEPVTDTKRILIADDDRQLASLFGLILEGDGRFRTLVIHCGSEVVAAARNFQPDLVLLDLHMPDCTGSQALAALRADREVGHTQVAFITGDHCPSDGPMFEGTPILHKPLPLNELISRAAEFLAA